MEVFDFEPDRIALRAEKSRIDTLQEIVKNLFRVIEISLFIISLTWAFARLPLAIKLSGDIFRQILHVVGGHRFVFLLGNSIVLILFLKSRCRKQGPQNPTEIAENIVATAGEIPYPAPEEVVYEEKRTISESKVKVHRRCQSEKQGEKNHSWEGLRRSNTAERRTEVEEEVDGLSNEEFQRAMEAFIDRQIKFHRQEKMKLRIDGGRGSWLMV